MFCPAAGFQNPETAKTSGPGQTVSSYCATVKRKSAL